MPREQPLDSASTERVRAAAATVLDRPVAAASPISEGLNAVYRLDLAGGDRAVLKLGTLDTAATLLVEPRMLDLLGDVAGLPVPEPLGSVAAAESQLGAAWFLTEYLPGEQVTDVFGLSPASHERLVREAGRHLAALHEIDIGAHVEMPGGQYGDLRVPGGDPSAPLTVVDSGVPAGTDLIPGHETWPARLETVVERVVAGLEGRTYTTDGRFPELVSVIHEAIANADLPTRPPVSPLHLDYRPANLVFEPEAVREAAEDDTGVVQGVVDFGEPETGDGLLDLALAEDALVGVPLGGTERGERLASVLRASYAGRRGGSVAFGERYTAYLLLARASRLGSVGYFSQFAREDDEAAVVDRWRERIRTLAAHLDGGTTPDARLRHEEQ